MIKLAILASAFSQSNSTLTLALHTGLQNHDVALSRGGRFLGAATFTSDVRLFEVQYTREGDLKRVAKVMDLKRAHNGQVKHPLSLSSLDWIDSSQVFLPVPTPQTCIVQSSLENGSFELCSFWLHQTDFFTHWQRQQIELKDEHQSS